MSIQVSRYWHRASRSLEIWFCRRSVVTHCCNQIITTAWHSVSTWVDTRQCLHPISVVWSVVWRHQPAMECSRAEVPTTIPQHSTTEHTTSRLLCTTVIRQLLSWMLSILLVILIKFNYWRICMWRFLWYNRDQSGYPRLQTEGFRKFVSWVLTFRVKVKFRDLWEDNRIISHLNWS